MDTAARRLTTSTGAEITRDPDLWFHDGSIVIVAEGIGFRVHQTLLSRLSPIFEGVFGIPQPSGDGGGDGTVEGVPILHVSDGARDMGYLLRAIYDGRNYLQDTDPEEKWLHVLSALVRLGHKYELPSIVDEAMGRLEDSFITDFESWLQYCDNSAEVTLSHPFEAHVGARLFESIRLARLSGRTAILPMAFYECCQLGIRTILQGDENGEGGITRLSEEDIEMCLSCREYLLKESVTLIEVLSRAGPPDSCESQDQCMGYFRLTFDNTVCMAQEFLTTDALEVHASRIARLSPQTFQPWNALCAECKQELKDEYNDELRRMWDELKGMLG